MILKERTCTVVCETKFAQHFMLKLSCSNVLGEKQQGLVFRCFKTILTLITDHSSHMGTTPVSYLVLSIPRPMFRGQVAVMNYNEVLELFFQVYIVLGVGEGVREGEGAWGNV